VASGHQPVAARRGSPAGIVSNTHRRGPASAARATSTIGQHARRHARRTGFPLHSTFAGSRLVRLLGEAAPPAAPADGMDFAERLSLWLGAFDAMGLQAAQQPVATGRDAAAARPLKAKALADDLQRVRGALASAIVQDPLFGATPAFAPYHERHLQLQRRMEQLIAPLRDHVRQEVSRHSPRLRQLAALDAVFEHALARREQALLPTVAARMKRRFEHWRATGTDANDAGAWERDFAAEWRQVLQAEVDLRLEPVAGLIEALATDMDQRSS
jgi:hypothetical protein